MAAIVAKTKSQTTKSFITAKRASVLIPPAPPASVIVRCQFTRVTTIVMTATTSFLAAGMVVTAVHRVQSP